MFCNKCGAKISDDSIFCSVCGARISVSEQSIDDEYEYEEEAVSFSSAPATQSQDYTDDEYEEYEEEDEESYDEENLLAFKFMGVDFKFSYDYTIAASAADDIVDIFQQTDDEIDELFDDIHASIEDVINKVLPAFMNGFNRMEDAFHNALLAEDCVHIGRDTVKVLFDRMYETCLEQSLQPYFEASDKLAEFAERLRSFRTIERASRGKWQGGGFGLRGALKGAIHAGILNAGTSLIRNIGDSITDSKDREEYRKLDRKLYFSIQPIIDIHILLIKITSQVIKSLHMVMQSNGCTDNEIVDFDVLVNLDRECENRCRILHEIDQSDRNIALFWKAYSDRIRAYPFDPYYYVNFVCDAHFDFSELRSLYPFIVIGELVRRYEAYYVAALFLDIRQYSESTKSEIDFKINELKWISTSLSADQNVDSEITRLQNKRAQMR